MFDPAQWIEARVTQRVEWDHGLFTFHLDEVRDFHAGQFTKLGLVVDDEPVSRAYSIASAPGLPLEFYVVAVEGGRLSPRLEALRPGDPVWVSPKTVGGFIAEKVPDGHDLWLIATGTGLAPYVSMLRHGAVLERFERVILVQGARWARQLGYHDELRGLHAEGRIHYVPAVTREAEAGCLHGRINALVQDGTLEEHAGAVLSAERSHVMMCGNPDMIRALTADLKERGMTLHTPRNPGQLHVERYW